jgi:hypothetical protein
VHHGSEEEELDPREELDPTDELRELSDEELGQEIDAGVALLSQAIAVLGLAVDEAVERLRKLGESNSREA